MQEETTNKIENEAPVEAAPVETVETVETTKEIETPATPTEIENKLDPTVEIKTEDPLVQTPTEPPAETQTQTVTEIKTESTSEVNEIKTETTPKIETKETEKATENTETAEVAGAVIPNAFLANMKNARELLKKARFVIQVRKQKKLDRILGLFTKKKKITRNDIESLLRTSEWTAGEYIKILIKQGKIKPSGLKGREPTYEKI